MQIVRTDFASAPPVPLGAWLRILVAGIEGTEKRSAGSLMSTLVTDRAHNAGGWQGRDSQRSYGTYSVNSPLSLPLGTIDERHVPVLRGLLPRSADAVWIRPESSDQRAAVRRRPEIDGVTLGMSARRGCRWHVG